jgi:hypothetical protein
MQARLLRIDLQRFAVSLGSRVGYPYIRLEAGAVMVLTWSWSQAVDKWQEAGCHYYAAVHRADDYEAAIRKAHMEQQQLLADFRASQANPQGEPK